MLPMFVILWYSSLYVHSLGSKYIKVNSEARSDAWQTAMANCGVHHDTDTEVLPPSLGGVVGLSAAGGDTAGAVSTALKNGNVTGGLSGFVNTFTTVISSIFPNPNGSQFLKTDDVSWRVPDLYDHSGEGKRDTIVQGTTTVVCNEAPMDGTIGAVAGAIVSILLGIVHMF